MEELKSTPDQLMSSKEIAILTDTWHSHVMAKIRTEIESLPKEYTETNFRLSEYKDASGKSNNHFLMTKSGALFISSSYKSEIRFAIQMRWEELEKKHAVPTTLIEALTLALEQAKTIEVQTKQLEQAQPKVDFYDQVSGSDDCMPIGDAEKILGTGRNTLFKILKEKCILMSNNMPYQYAINAYLFKVVTYPYDQNGVTKMATQTLITPKGIQYVAKQLKK